MKTLKAKTELLKMLVEYSYQENDTESIPLSSGKMSKYYVDCKATTMKARAMPLVGELISAFIPPDTEAIGGLTMGSDPISLATSYYCWLQGRELDTFSIRKEPKNHGLKKWIEGINADGNKVVVVDDVVTTGGSTIKAIERCREANLDIVAIVVLVDRQEENGLDKIKDIAGPGISVRAAIKLSEIIEFAAREL